MIDIQDKSRCSGCEACVQICPRKCISCQTDSEGFVYPEVNHTECIECGLCEKVCHIFHPYDARIPIKTLAAKNIDEMIRVQSSSGGFFTAIAEKVIDDEGVVFGVKFDSHWMPVFSYTETKARLSDFRGSKYVQAKVRDAYIKCRTFLRQDRNVLFCGTPCQISALYHFLGKRYDERLTTVDFVCHGVPSPCIWSDYLEKIQGNRDGDYIYPIKNVNFRDKSSSWSLYHFNLTTNGMTINSPAWENPYMRAFLSNYSLRPSCYDCQVRNSRSSSDITMGDCWGIDRMIPDFSDDKGVSLLLINTLKGSLMVDGLALNTRNLSFKEVCENNSSIILNPKKPHKRGRFFTLLSAGKPLQTANDMVHAVPFYQKLLWSIRQRIHI